jgi:hypothetical protein
VNLSEFADALMGRDSQAGPPSTLVAARYAEALEDPVGARALVATIFWQAFTQLPQYAQFLDAADLGPAGMPWRHEIIVPHGNEPWRYALVVLDKHVPAEPVIQIPSVTDAELASGWRRFERLTRSLRVPSQYEDLLREEPTMTVEAGRSFSSGVIVAQLPALVPTASVPTSPIRILDKSPTGGMVGVFARDIHGRVGVTLAHHAVQQDSTDVILSGRKARIVSRDEATDSCFAIVEDVDDGTFDLRSNPSLRDRPPNPHERLTFERDALQSVTTEVTGWDKKLPFVLTPWSHLRVFTEPTTTQGDSGLALVVDEKLLVGFASYRTAETSNIEFSAWTWAHSVLCAHGLQ